MEDPLISLLENYWKDWDNTCFSVEPTETDEYIIYTDNVNGLGNGINFYLTPHKDNTFTLSDRDLTSYHIDRSLANVQELTQQLAALAANYGVAMNNRGEFVRERIKADELSDALNEFTDLLVREMDLARRF